MNKAILICIKPKWCAKIMNGEKTIEVRTSKALANAIQKLINEYGYADICAYCSKSNYLGYISNKYVGKVIFKFRCYKVEKYPYISDRYDKLIGSCLSEKELLDYSTIKEENGIRFVKTIYTIHISKLEIFDRPRELNEFYTTKLDEDLTKRFDNSIQLENKTWVKPITKAPQNFCYCEVLK